MHLKGLCGHFAVAILVLGGCIASTPSPTIPGNASWTRVSDPNTGFSVEFPGSAKTTRDFNDNLEQFQILLDATGTNGVSPLNALVSVNEHGHVSALEVLEVSAEAAQTRLASILEANGLRFEPSDQNEPVMRDGFLSWEVRLRTPRSEGHIQILVGRTRAYVVAARCEFGSADARAAAVGMIERLLDSLDLPEWDRILPENESGWVAAQGVDSPWVVQVPGSVQFPDFNAAAEATDWNTAAVMLRASDETQGHGYVVSWIPLRERPRNDDLDARLDHWIGDGYQLVDTSYGAVDGFPARRHRLRSAEATMHLQLLSTPPGLFEMRVVTPLTETNEASGDVRRFMDSFTPTAVSKLPSA